jgi:hypothetical protein
VGAVSVQAADRPGPAGGLVTAAASSTAAAAARWRRVLGAEGAA